MNILYCISVSYKNADLEIRKKLNFTEEECKEISSELINRNIVTECVILCTCNRTEVYFCGKKGAERELVSIIAEKGSVAESLLSKYVMSFSGDNSITHLFKVASGIDSMVIGEDEILGQTRTAYLLAKDNHTVAYELNMVFQAALTCAKKVKTETALSKTSVSVATLAANEAAKFADKVNVLVIGASGKIGTTVLKNLISHKNISVKATLRKHNSQFKFIDDMGVETVDYNDRYSCINNADCIISATSSPHYTITHYDLKKYVSEEKHRLFIDLAVPPDIDSSISSLDGVRLINIDYFDNLAEENNAVKLSSVNAAEQIISAEIDTLKKDMAFHYFLPMLDDIKKSLHDKSLEELIYRMKSETSSKVFSDFLAVLKTFKN